jgi:hypothetical protein
MDNTSGEMFKKGLDKAFSQVTLNGDTMLDMMNAKQGVKEEDVSEKWTEKYKRSIDCSHPKGFSQRAHCQGKKKKSKSETKEATGSGSAGAFSAPVFGGDDNEFWDKSRAESHLANKLKEGRKPFKDAPKVKIATNDDGVTFRVGDDAKTLDTKENIKIEYLSKKDGGIRAGYKNDYGAQEIHIDGLTKPKMNAKKLKEETEKVETKEATGSGSVGGYSSPAMWAKSTKKKDWGPSRKPLYKGGKFVSVKSKCTKFPYCNQGDINALNISKNESVKEAIKNVAKQLNLSENVIRTILEYEYKKLNKRTK